MPVYVFICPKNHETRRYLPLDQFRERITCTCGKRAVLGIPKNLIMRSFKPYIEENMTGKPIRIETAEQRDKLCKKHGVTYDRIKNPPSRKAKCAIDEVSLGTVMETIETGRTPDGEKLDEPVKLSKKELKKFKSV